MTAFMPQLNIAFPHIKVFYSHRLDLFFIQAMHKSLFSDECHTVFCGILIFSQNLIKISFEAYFGKKKSPLLSWFDNMSTFYPNPSWHN